MDAPTGSVRQSPVALVVEPRHRDLEGVTVNRVWPTARRRLVGPFIFFDHLLPLQLEPGRGLDVPPHPHIGLATVTYLFAGEMLHRDSLGIEQTIRPGDLNWMTAGAGIVHSERSTDRARFDESELHAIQTWVALPRAHERVAPSFEHYPRARIPRTSLAGVDLTVIAGAAFGLRSPAATLSDLFYVEAVMPSGTELVLEEELGERAIYIVGGGIEITSEQFAAGRLIVLEAGRDARLRAGSATRLMLFGGAPLETDRLIWWNFVASTEALIEAAKRRWAERAFPRVPGDAGMMPMPPG